MSRTTLPGFVAGCLLLLALAGTSSAQNRFDHEDVIQKRIPARAGETLTLKSDMGSVRLTGDSGQNEVLVTVIKGVNRADEDEAAELFEKFEVTFDETSNGVTITGEYDRPSWWRRGNGLQVRYEIRVPHQYNVALATAGGSIEIEDLAGGAEAKTSGGSITVTDIDGRVIANTSGGSIRAAGIRDDARLHTSGGSITAEDIQGSAECNTSGGSITVNSIRGDLRAHTSGGGINIQDAAGTVDASTSGGSITADLSGQPDGPVSLKTSGGSLTVEIDSAIHAEIDAHTTGGRINSEIPISGTMERGAIRGELNGGGPLFTLRTVGGGINIRKR